MMLRRGMNSAWYISSRRLSLFKCGGRQRCEALNMAGCASSRASTASLSTALSTSSTPSVGMSTSRTGSALLISVNRSLTSCGPLTRKTSTRMLRTLRSHSPSSHSSISAPRRCCPSKIPVAPVARLWYNVMTPGRPATSPRATPASLAFAMWRERSGRRIRCFSQIGTVTISARDARTTCLYPKSTTGTPTTASKFGREIVERSSGASST
mmetsp:Transcript_16931/g.42928  ORF Transcript_16931/g.42928 Transcript_16931/m.42928 type:complete len:211 (-) Transcript_16931:181-813(-)